ncbi:YccF domain-containing protein [Streptacidiphilus melanogenes]|uniref:YccF domain-containing protein n=1 Tax=Streptacidiphilus melanogenes TaxID=411235 RepID=UPI003F70ADCF
MITVLPELTLPRPSRSPGRPARGCRAAIGSVIWIVFAGRWLALGHPPTSIALFITIIGVPLAIANSVTAGQSASATVSSLHRAGSSTCPPGRRPEIQGNLRVGD